MKLFAALERALLARWRKIKAALKLNRWPLLSLKEQRLQLKKQYLESLFRKKWQKFERSIYDVYKVRFPPWHQYYYRPFSLMRRTILMSPTATRTDSTVDAGWDWSSAGSATSQSCNMDALDSCVACVAICWRSSLKTVSSRIRLRLTIICDSNEMSKNAEISTQSQFGRL